MIKVKIVEDVTICDCCGKKNLKRAMEIKYGGKTHLGVTCAGNRFDLNLSGNPYEAAKRLEFHINNLDKEDLDEIMEEIKSDNVLW